MRFADLMAPVLMACWGMGRLLGPQLMVAGGGHATHQWFGMYYAGQVGRRLPVPIFQSIEDFTIFGILLLVERWLRVNAPAPVPVPVATTVAATAPEVSPLSVATAAAPDGVGQDGADGADGHPHVGPDGLETAGVGPDGLETAGRPGGHTDGQGGGPTDPLSEDGGGVTTAVLLPPAGIVIGVGMVLWGIERFLDEHLWLGEDGHLGSLLVQWAGIALAVAGVLLLATRVGPLQRWRRGEGGELPPGREGQAVAGGLADSTADTGQEEDDTPVASATGGTTDHHGD
jgi:hypothetical protein